MRYRLYGLIVASAVPLPQAVIEQSYDPTDIEISAPQKGPVEDVLAEGTTLQAIATQRGLEYSTVRVSADVVLLRFHRLADFWIKHSGMKIDVVVAPGCDSELLGLLISGNLLSTVLALRGETVLHASAIEHEGRAIAFVADSGMGKSTLAARCCAAGASFFSDDVLRTEVRQDGTVGCWRGTTEVRLRGMIDDFLAEPPSAGVRVTIDARSAWTPPRSQSDFLTLSHIILPIVDRDAHELEMCELVGSEALFAVAKHPRLLGWMDLGVRRSAFSNLSAVSRGVRVYRARIPWETPPKLEPIERLLTKLASDPMSSRNKGRR